MNELWQSTVAAIPLEAGILLAIALLVSSLGIIRVVWFVSLGYAGSVTLIAGATAVLFRDVYTPWTLAHGALLIIYGVRLGGYLVRRELLPAYAPAREDARQRGADVKLALKPLIWVSVALLYVMMTAPYLLTLQCERLLAVISPSAPQVIGMAIAAAGLGLEALADHQKSAYKAANPGRWCDVGLYRLVRCPNYLGEMVFWVGIFVSGLAAYDHAIHWIATVVGLVCIQLIMVGSTKRLEAGQLERYGEHADFQEYITSVPVLFPFVPIYTLKNVRVYLE